MSGLDLPLDEVGAGDHLRDGVLYLQPSVHFHEVKVEVLVHDELDGAGADVVHGSAWRVQHLKCILDRFHQLLNYLYRPE